MKKFRLKLFILSALLLTLSSGLLFYKHLFLTDFNTNRGKNNFLELRYLDSKINELMAMERRHLEPTTQDITEELNLANNKIHDLIFIILDIHQNDEKIKNSIRKIETYFKDKSEAVSSFQLKMKDLRKVTNDLNPLFFEIQKKNIKFTLDKRDFYRECITDAFYYLSAPSKTNENQLLEDKKILTQIIGISSTPDPTIQEYFQSIDEIITLNTEIENIFISLRQKSIEEEMNYISTYYNESNSSLNDQGQNFLILVFIAITFYISTLVIIFRKL